MCLKNWYITDSITNTISYAKCACICEPLQTINASTNREYMPLSYCGAKQSHKVSAKH